MGDQFSSEWCHFLNTITLFNQVIHHNDKVKPKKLFSFTLKMDRNTVILIKLDAAGQTEIPAGVGKQNIKEGKNQVREMI